MQIEFNFDADPHQAALEYAVGAPVELYRASNHIYQLTFYYVLTADHLFDVSIHDDGGSFILMRYTRSRIPQSLMDRVIGESLIFMEEE